MHAHRRASCVDPKVLILGPNSTRTHLLCQALVRYISYLCLAYHTHNNDTRGQNLGNHRPPQHARDVDRNEFGVGVPQPAQRHSKSPWRRQFSAKWPIDIQRWVTSHAANKPPPPDVWLYVTQIPHIHRELLGTLSDTWIRTHGGGEAGSVAAASSSLGVWDVRCRS